MSIHIDNYYRPVNETEVQQLNEVLSTNDLKILIIAFFRSYGEEYEDEPLDPHFLTKVDFDRLMRGVEFVAKEIQRGNLKSAARNGAEYFDTSESRHISYVVKSRKRK